MFFDKYIHIKENTMYTMSVNRTWFKDHGWEKMVDETTETPEYSETIKRHQLTYRYGTKVCGKHEIYARWDFHSTVVYYKGRIQRRSSYYMFTAWNTATGFHVENRITHHPITVDQIKAAMLVVGVVL